MDESAAHQIPNHFFKIVLRDVLASGDFSAARHARRMIGKINHRTKCVLDLARYLHQAHVFSIYAGVAAARTARIFSTYLTSMSFSILTESPGCLKPSVVDRSVCGITSTEKLFSLIEKIVRLIPSIATEPFSTR